MFIHFDMTHKREKIAVFTYRSPHFCVTRTWSLAATVSVPSCSDGPPLPNGERRTRLSCRSQKKHFAHTLETCLSRLRSDDIVTPRTRTWSLAATLSVPSCSDGPPLPNGVCPYLEPTQTSSVFSLFSLSLLADIQWLTSVRQCSCLLAANVILSR